MNRFPLWKYVVILSVLIIGVLYTLPNFYKEAPAIQVSEKSSTNPITTELINNITAKLAQNNISPNGMLFENKILKFTFSDIDTQLNAKDLIQDAFGTNYIIALNLVSTAPSWLAKIHANPMFLGLDLRGGVHFLLEVDTEAAIKKMLDKNIINIKQILQNKQVRFGDIEINQQTIAINFRDNETANNAFKLLKEELPQLEINSSNDNNLKITTPETEIQKIKLSAIKQNILILHNRVNELGVAEPIIQQQGPDRIIVELPGIQDTARAKEIIGRIATLEMHIVNDNQPDVSSAINGNVKNGYTLLEDISHETPTKILINKTVELTGDNITDAQAGFNEQGKPAVIVRLDSDGANIFKDLTKNNIGKRLAMVLVDKDTTHVITAPVIRSEIGGGQVQISGSMDVQEASDIALLLRSGSLAAPMQIIEEYMVGPTLGYENIVKGFHSVLWGFVAIAVFMIIYYLLFGLIAVLSLVINLLLLVALLSMLQATLTLPGIAAIALALGMAIDANVLINERVREELRKGNRAHGAIEAGYKHAWGTILDSNVTTLIAGLALLAFGSGSIRGFAVVHCLGILTSMFSAVFISRGIVGFLYAKRHIKKLSIG